MAQKTVILVVHADGRTELEAKYFEGRDCEKVLKDFEQLLGAKKAEHKKPEYYVNTEHRVTQR